MKNETIKPLGNLTIKPALAWALSLFVGLSYIVLLYDFIYNDAYFANPLKLIGIVSFLGGAVNTYLWYFITDKLLKKGDGVMNKTLMYIIVGIYALEPIGIMLQSEVDGLLIFLHVVGIVFCAIVLLRKYDGELHKYAKLQLISAAVYIVVALVAILLDSIVNEDELVFVFNCMYILTLSVYFPFVLTEGMYNEKRIDFNDSVSGWLFFFLWFFMVLPAVTSLLSLFGIFTVDISYRSPFRRIANLALFAMAEYALIAVYKRRNYAVSCLYYYAAIVLINGALYIIRTSSNPYLMIFSSKLILSYQIGAVIGYTSISLPFILYPLYSKKLDRMFPKTNRTYSKMAIVLAGLIVVFNIISTIDETNYYSRGEELCRDLFNYHRLPPGNYINKEEDNYSYDDYDESDYFNDDGQTSDDNLDDMEIKNITVNGVDFSMVLIESGSFNMGATDEQGSDAGNDEKPVHLVEINHNFYIGQTEVTQKLWEAVMTTNPSKHIGNDLPVEMVSWNDCVKFIEKLNELTELHFRLPTEEEWEYACRGGNYSNGYRYSGSDDADEIGWSVDNSGKQSHSVGKKVPNEVGLYDMSGNVYEWCQNRYSSYGDQGDSSSNMKGNERVRRGGSWKYSNSCCRVSFRGNSPLAEKRDDLGFRLVLDD